ncbi:hypothetical protein DPMN_143643 [Dreissena polymorpha]|uniref:Uncharacterized protein n=1 Tax=Dreissena polymorpha TaxID=45954 RepID=A0A9D4JPI1_DREPO|nr:hypothetical protein DPMN_143643 [Dreissena polymorpha]
MFQVDVQEQTSLKVGFFRLCGLPHVLGAVDRTMIPTIIAPKEHKEACIRRKGSHAMNVPEIVDSELR